MNKPEFWRLQKTANLSNLAVAEWLGVSKRVICKWRSGESEAPKAVIMSLEYRIKYGCLPMPTANVLDNR